MPEGGQKTTFDAGTIALVASGQSALFRNAARNFIAGVDSAWFSPLEPMAPASPPGTGPRILDYPVGINLQIEPRSGEGIDFRTLRQFADGYDLLRTVIETRKDQVCKIPLDFRLKQKPGESAKQLRQRSDQDEAVARVRAFFEFPDAANDFLTWLRLLLEDLFVIDAPSILVNKNRGGGVHSLEVIDGGTIVPKIDAQGRRPMPPDVAYQQVIKGIPSVDLTADQLIYRPRNRRAHRIYGYSPVEQILTTINIGIRKQLGQLDFFTEGTIPLGIAQVGDTWSADQIKQFQAMFDAKYAGNQPNRSKLIFTPKLEKLDFPKLQAQKDEFDEWLARLVCFAFSVSPTPFIRQMNRATAKTSQETSQEEGTLPLLKWLGNVLNYLIGRVLGEPTVEAVWETSLSSDPLKQSQMDASDVDSPILTPNEVRVKRGLDPVANGDELGCKTATGWVPIRVSIEQAQAVAAGSGENERDGQDAPRVAGKVLGKKKLLTATVEIAAPEVVAAQASLKASTERLFANVGHDVAAKVTAKYGAVAKTADDEDAAKRRRHDELLAFIAALELDWSELVPDAEAALAEAAQSGAGDGSASTGASDAQAQRAADDAVAAAKGRAAEMVGMKRVGDELVANADARWAITESTRDGLRSLIEQAVNGGWSSSQLADAITEGYLFSAARAETIARTEIAKAQVAGNLAGWDSSGVVAGTRWLLASTHDLDDVCDANAAAGVVLLGNVYPSGDMGAPAHPNCKCAMVAVLKEK